MRALVSRTIVFTAGLLALSVPARAELVYFTAGHTLSVKAYRTEGSHIRLTMRNGGEMICDAALVARIAPDEVPYPEPAAPAEEENADSGAAPVLAGPFESLIKEVARAYHVDPALVHAVVTVESAHRPRARSPKGAMGLMQLMPATARQYAVRNPYDPRTNLEAGVRHLRNLLDRYEVALALAAYNAGEAAVVRYGGIPPFQETRQYVQKVLSLVRRER